MTAAEECDLGCGSGVQISCFVEQTPNPITIASSIWTHALNGVCSTVGARPRNRQRWYIYSWHVQQANFKKIVTPSTCVAYGALCVTALMGLVTSTFDLLIFK